MAHASKAQAEKILVFDFGSQFAQLIARRVREQKVYCELVRHDLPVRRVRELAPKGLILSGSPCSVYDAGAPRIDPEILQLGIPVLGLCYGMQLVCDVLGGEVRSHPAREYGRTRLTILGPSPLFQGVPEESYVWMSHGDQVQSVSAAFVPLARTETCPIAAVRHHALPIFALQFHPEVTHTQYGATILRNFLFQECGCTGAWDMGSFRAAEVAAIQTRVGADHVICGLSGGVDSAVTAALIHEAIGSQLTCIFVDNGLLRHHERQVVEQTFRDHFHIDLRVVDAQQQFLTRLAGVSDPQQKREIIGHVFVDVFKAEARSIPNVKYLAQGTLYPDVIESGQSVDGPAATIKTHHNVGGLPAELGFLLLEPLRDLFKDEVRRLGTELGLPEKIVARHPFPGPGLSVRVLGDVTAEKLEKVRQADAILLEEIKKAGLYGEISQAFAVLLPIHSVGVMGDGRTYEQVIALRAVTTTDFMTADWARIDPDVLARISTRIINEVRGVNRVVYDISTKPPATIEWE